MSPQMNVMSETRPTNHLAADGTGDWREASACDESTAYLFHAPTAESERQRAMRVQAALTVCRGCPVRVECAQDAVDTGDTWGIRGGHTTEQLRNIVRRHNRKDGA